MRHLLRSRKATLAKAAKAAKTRSGIFAEKAADLSATGDELLFTFAYALSTARRDSVNAAECVGKCSSNLAYHRELGS